MTEKIKIGVLHGLLTNGGNAGDRLIYERGEILLEFFWGNDFDFTYIARFRPFNGNFDGLIILGGPLIARKIHPQSENIIKYIKKNRDIPIFSLGLGVDGKICDSYKDYFLDDESIRFWKYVYETSKLFSVRDRITYEVLINYGIKAELTGCPALFNLEILEGNKGLTKNGEINKIAVTIPHLKFVSPRSAKGFLSSVKPLLLTSFFLIILKMKFHKKELGLIFQHGYTTLATKIMRILANTIGIKTYDLSVKSWDSFMELHEFDIHIGTRLHPHIYFLSLNKPSFLLNVDLRTEAFLKTLETPNDKYTISGTTKLVNMLADRITENNFDEFNNVHREITTFYIVMKNFLNKIFLFYRRYGD